MSAFFKVMSGRGVKKYFAQPENKKTTPKNPSLTSIILHFEDLTEIQNLYTVSFKK
jgi:hypothetical protein